ncbi:MAG: prolipoprotein diacylglyceryl transferase [Bacteroidetes bacterium]|nr:prolipoprotein diacylglyceryl transferase [Bacteroidota bacterium]
MGNNFFEKLKDRWGVDSLLQVLLILIIFSVTGFSVLFLKKPVVSLLDSFQLPVWLSNTIYFVLIIPVYQLLLLLFAFVFGQFKFFWNYEKKTLKRMRMLFSR